MPDDQITASSYYRQKNLYAWEGRLNNNDYWATKAGQPTDPWIQVDLLRNMLVTGIITQGSTHVQQEWVTILQIQYGDSENTLMFIMENGQPKVGFVFTFSNMFLYYTAYHCEE